MERVNANGVTEHSTAIMLIPDDKYKSVRPWVPDIHLTLGFFGFYPLNAAPVKKLRETVKVMSVNLKKVNVIANGTGIFPERDAFAVVDLIDGIEVFYAREMLETFHGRHTKGRPGVPMINYTHGFTPHVTRDRAIENGLTPEMVRPRTPVEFQFVAIGLWHGSQRTEIELR